MKSTNIYFNPSVFITLLIIVPSIFLIYFNWSTSQNKSTYKTIDGDGLDYYSYLTSTFITKDIAHLNSNNPFVVETATGNINLHPVGVAVLQLPFFILGYIFANLSHTNLDGYSLPFQFSISLAALVYLVMGIWFIYKTLSARGYSNTISLTSILCLFFGTTLIHYTINEPSMSHIYSFALVSAFIFYTQELARHYSNRTLFLIAFLLGFIILVRPINILIILFIPFFYNSFSDFKNRMKLIFLNKKTILFSTFIVIGILSIQSLVWYIQTNQFFQFSYKGNGFYFLNPQLSNMLFGFNSGIFIYTPFFLFMIVALIILFKLNMYKGLCVLMFSIISLYIFSSYWGWTYFDGIGTRVFVDYSSILALGFAGIIHYFKSFKPKLAISLFGMIFIIYNMIICYQYKQGIIQACGMNAEKYKYVFLKTDPSFKNCLGGSYDLQPYSKEKKESFLSLNNDFENKKEHYYLYNTNEYGVEFNSGNLNIKSKKLHLKINFDRFDFSSNPSKEALMAVSFE